MTLTKTPADDRQPLGFGLLGYGFMGKAHSNALRTIPYMFWPSKASPVMVAMAGRTESRVRDAAIRYGYPDYTTDWRDLVADERIDIFDNVAADPAHFAPTIAALQHGKHVICEKPLASTVEDAQRMYEAAEVAGVRHLVCFNYRFFPAVRLAWELVHSGDMGELHQARFRYSQEWRRDAQADLQSPVGALDIIGCHAIDQARFLCGEITSVAASMASPVTTPKRLYNGHPVEQDDVVAILAHFASGLVATIDASLVSPGRRNHLAWELSGSRGSLSWDLENPNILRVYRHSSQPATGFTEVIVCEPHHPLMHPWWPSGHVLGWEHGHINMLAHFCDAVANDTPIEPYGATFYDGFRVAQIGAAVRKASETMRVTAVAEPPIVTNNSSGNGQTADADTRHVTLRMSHQQSSYLGGRRQT